MPNEKFTAPNNPDPDKEGGSSYISDKLNTGIQKSEILGGAHLNELKIGRKLIIKTLNSTYVLERREDGDYLSGGNITIPEKVSVSGSTFGGSALKAGFIGRGMCMEVRFLNPSDVVTTSFVREITEEDI